MKTVSIGTCGNYNSCFHWNMWKLKRLFPFEHVVTTKPVSFGTCGYYKECFY